MKEPSQKITVTVTSRTVLRVVFLVIASYIFVRFLVNISHILTLIFVSFFLALALNPAVSWISRRLKSKSRIAATGLAYVLVISTVVTFFSLIIPPLVQQTVDFVREVPGTIEQTKTQDTAVGRFVRRYQLDDQLDSISRDFSARIIPQFSGKLFNTASRIGGAIISIVTVLVLTFMMLVEGPDWLDKIWSVQPKSRQQHYKIIAGRMYRVVTGYVNGQLLIAMIAGAFSLVALLIASTLMDAPVNAVAMAGIITMMGLIPMIGNTIGAAIVVLVCLFVSVPLAIVMAVFFLLYQQIENVTIQPYIQAKQNELTPLLVFVAALMGVGFGGLLGGFIAIPAAGCLKILIEDFLERKKLASETA